RLAMNFEHAIDEVYDPVVRDPRACICRGLPSSGDAQARLRDLDDERRARRMRLDVITRRAPDDADVRLRLGPVVEDDRTLCLNEPTLSERPLHRLRHEKHRRPVRAVLRFLHEQQPIEQLDRVVLVEEAVVDQPLVLATRPAMQDGPFRWRNGMKLTRMLERRSTSLNGYDRNDHNRRSRARSPASRSRCSRSRSRSARSRSHLALSRSSASRAATSHRAAFSSTADCRTRVDAAPAASVTLAKYEWMSSMFFCSAVLAAWSVLRSAPS